jgi:hypothetical protein
MQDKLFKSKHFSQGISQNENWLLFPSSLMSADIEAKGPWLYRSLRSSEAEHCCSYLACSRPARAVVNFP